MSMVKIRMPLGDSVYEWKWPPAYSVKCNKCGAMFNKKKELRQHMYQVHSY